VIDIDNVTPPILPLSKGRVNEKENFETMIGTEFSMDTKKEQLFPVDTKVSCPELFGTTRNVRLKADIIIKRGEVSQESRIDKVMQNGGFWLSIGLAAGYENGTSFAQIEIPGHL